MSSKLSPEFGSRRPLKPARADEFVKGILIDVVPNQEIELPKEILDVVRVLAESIYEQTRELSDEVLTPNVVQDILNRAFSHLLSDYGFTSVVMRNGYQSREHLLKGTRVWAVGDTSNGHGYSFWFESNNQQIVIVVEKYSVGIRLAGTPE